MATSIKLSALLIASQLDMKGIKASLTTRPLADSSSELFVKSGEGSYEYFFNYGVVVFSGLEDEAIKKRVSEILSFAKNPLPASLKDDHLITVSDESDLDIEFDHVSVNRLDDKVIRITMLNLAQSVALDRYHEVSEVLLTEIKKISSNLELTGKLKLNRYNMMRFMGKALNMQNEIAENIYVFDAPDMVWDDEYLDRLHQGLMKHFDLRTRFTEVEYTLRIIQNNLSIFREISSQRESNMLEWIIIILILAEVFDLFISKFL